MSLYRYLGIDVNEICQAHTGESGTHQEIKGDQRESQGAYSCDWRGLRKVNPSCIRKLKQPAAPAEAAGVQVFEALLSALPG